MFSFAGGACAIENDLFSFEQSELDNNDAVSEIEV